MNTNQETFLNCGMVAIVGAPNAGKSTLINQICKEKVAIVSHVPQTTRHAIRAIHNDARGQIVFIDTPGSHKAKNTLHKVMNNYIKEALEGADIILNLVDTNKEPLPNYNNTVESLLKLNKFIILGLNKLDLKHTSLQKYLDVWEQILKKPLTTATDQVISLPLSGLNNKNIDSLINLIFEKLPQSPPLFPDNILTDFPAKVAYSDIVREKLIYLLREELPHSLAVFIDVFQEEANKIVIGVKIVVEKQGQKKIVIGENGLNLKTVKQRAIKEIRPLVNKRIKMDLWVTIKKDWQTDKAFLKEAGYILE